MGKFVERPHEVRFLPDIRDIIHQGRARYGSRIVYEDRHVKGETERKKISYQQLYDDVNALGTALLQRGLKGKNIAVMSENRYDWVLTYYAVVCGVGVIVPLDRELPAGELVNLLTRARVSALVYSDKQEKTLAAAAGQLDFLEYEIHMDASEKTAEQPEKHLSLSALLAEGYASIAAGKTEYLEAEIDPNALMAIYFTSGTTGQSKGVMLSHRNVASNVENMLRRMYIDTKSRGLSVLPIHHTFEFTCEVVPCMVGGGCLVFGDGLKYIQKNLREDHINIMLGVPLVFETFHRKIMTTARLKGQEGRLRRGMKINALLQKGGWDRSRRMFREIYDLIGTEIQVFIVGGAPMDPEVIRDFRALGVNMFEGYGLTETAPIIAVNADYQQKTGTVGPPMPGTQVRISEPDEEGIGEIVVRTESRMIGYYDNPEETRKVIDDEGWFYTGDYGMLDAEGFLHVTGRKKNVIVTKNGKNIFPEELEYLLNKSELVKESLVWGKEEAESGEWIIQAEIVVEKEAAKDLSEEELHAKMKEVVEAVNRSTTNYKRIRGFHLREEEFEKTSTKKIQRHKVKL